MKLVKWNMVITSPKTTGTFRNNIGKDASIDTLLFIISGITFNNGDSWNWSKIPVLPGALTCLLKSKINDMTTPWFSIGMCFSAFSWHTEDQYAYSIDYMHFGDTKTWYGVPGADAEKLEAAMKKMAPETLNLLSGRLVDTSPMLNPRALLKENVPVYAIDQGPGEFVLTFPKAYHSGFNHGVGINQMVQVLPLEI
jgi:histone demethylase JARID1